MHTVWKGCIIACVAVLAVSGSQAANADPFVTPSAGDIVGVGSETMQFVINDLADGYNYSPSNPIDKVYYWNATGSPTIIPKANAPEISRPNGSSSGITALINNRSLDFAGSTREPQAGDTISTNSLLFFPLAEDELRYAKSAQVPSNVPDGLTYYNLADIYRCAVTDWNAFNPSAPVGSTIVPYLPPPGSGTRDYFLRQLGLNETYLGTCVLPRQVNDPTPIQSDPNAIAPFSVARSTYPTNLVNPPAPGTPVIALNTTGFDAWRPLYMVTRNAGGFTVPAYLLPLVGDGATVSGGWLCGPAAQAIVAQQGFGSVVFPPGSSHTVSTCGIAEHI